MESEVIVPGSPEQFAADTRRQTVGSFFIFRYLMQYMVFLDDRSPPMANGVIVVADPIQDLVGEKCLS
jgi:hypothetical protein